MNLAAERALITLGMSTVKVTDATFEREVLASEIPVLVDFWATWCQPCRVVAPVLEELSEAYAGRLKIAKLDIDANPQIASLLRIQSIPTMVLFAGGQPVEAVQGALPKDALQQFIDKHVGSAPPGQAPTKISPEDLKKLMDAGQPTVVFDLREPQHFSRSHLRRARCVTVDRLAAEAAQVPRGTLIVLVDRTGEQTEDLAKSLLEQGISAVSLEKGLLAWEGSQFPTYSDKEEARLDA